MTDGYIDGDDELKLMEAELDLELERERKLGAEEPAAGTTDAEPPKKNSTSTSATVEDQNAAEKPENSGDEPDAESPVFEDGVGKFL